MDKLQALNQFWNSFGIPAYDQYSVPDDAKMPYITYETVYDDFDHPVSVTASVWYRDVSWAAVTLKVDEIEERISRGGCTVPYDDGAFWVIKGTPWAQRMDDPADDMIRRIVLNIMIEFCEGR